MSPAATAASCNLCHVSTGFTTAHRDGKISFQPNINISPATGKYMKYGFQALTSSQVSNPTLGTCATINCHFETVTPVWGSAPATTNCDTCHLAQPATASHSKHESYYGGTSSCEKCHIARASFSHATSAGHRPLAFASSLTYSGEAASYLPSQSGSRVFGSCSNLYCHSDGTKNAGPFAGKLTPTWGTNTLTCASCHGGASASTSAIATNSHTQHIDNAGLIGVTITCDKCHNATTADGATISNMANHANGVIDVKLASGTYSTDGHLPGGALGSCSATTCHNPGRTGVTPAALTVTWGTNGAPNKCAICHGTTNPVGAPDYANGGQAAANANSHPAHAITRGIGCQVCHNQTTTTGNTITGTKHLDGSNQDVSFTFGTFSGHYTSATKTCSNTYCHVSGTPVWGATLLADCTSCHGGDASSAAAIGTGKHTQHVNNASYPALGCVECHAKTVSANRTIGTQGNHVNGFKDFSGAKAPKQTVADGSCSLTYCHSNGKGVQVATGNWVGGAALGCNGCHGTGNSYGAPDYASGAAGSLSANSHGKHATASADCVKCHSTTTGTGTAILAGSTTHLDKTINARFSKANFTTYSGAYNPGAKTCSATYCHGGSVTSPVWGTTGPLPCETCHKASNALPAGHTIHYATATAPTAGGYLNAAANLSAAGSYQFSCASCHGNSATNHANGPAASGSDATIFFGFSSAGRGAAANTAYVRTGTSAADAQGFNYTTNNNNCTTTYCHSDGRGNNGAGAALTWSTAASAPGGSCGVCHGTATTIASGKHAEHLNRGAVAVSFGCVDCHAKTVSNNTTISNKAMHVNKFRDYSGVKAGRNISSCATNYCHSNGKGVAGAAVTWTDASSATCTKCHGTTGTTFGAPDYSSGGAGTPSANSHGLAGHVSASTSCATCHNASVDAAGLQIINPATHVDKNINVNFAAAVNGASATFTPGTKTCAVNYCHGSGSPVWGGNTAAVTCEKCHGSAATATAGTFWSTAGVTLKTDAKTGAHLAHLASATVNGHSITVNLACNDCHLSVTAFTDATHLHGANSVGQSGMAWSALATNSGALTPSYNAGTGACSNVYCHGATLADNAAPTKVAPVWNTPILSASASLANCGACHGNPPATSGHITNPVGPVYVASTSCNSCHSHVNTDGMSFNDVSKHANGVVDGGTCNACHGYPPVQSMAGLGLHDNYTTARLQNYSGGGGAHNIPAHIALMAKATDTWSPCKICHPTTSHNQGAGVFVPGNVQVSVDPKFKFNPNLPITYTGKQTGTPLSAGSCANVSCHFKFSPKWSSER